ncbi:hypothetical protein OS493_023007 [Desmophyllum pertusum]|uniref:Uncharacterized protein n=1 Tax=Desmophyllum pertusum TaxID=174260 RepID=A0A9W9ZBF0_9CNID|nr:hypothetical protein OS493_023007 [Desmophyllum pertusum]
MAASQKYKVRSADEYAEEFKGKEAVFSRTLRGLEDRVKKCESLKIMDKESSKALPSRGDDRFILDWQPYLNDAKRKLSRSLTKLKEIQNHRKQRKNTFIGSVKEALPSWAKKKGSGKHLQLQQLINDTEDYEALITDIVSQINPADDLTNLVNKIFQERHSNQDDKISKDLQVLTTRWNSLCEKRHQQRQQVLDEDNSGTTSNDVKEKLQIKQDQLKKVQGQKPALEEISRDADNLLNSGRLDQGDTERVERYKGVIGARYTALSDRLYSDIHQFKKKPEGKKEETAIVEVSVQPNLKSPRKIISPFHKEDETKSNQQKINDSMAAVKTILAQEQRQKLKPRTEREKERIQEEPVKAFDSSLLTCWKVLNDLDEESLQKFSAVGSNIKEVREQLDEIQELEQKMTQEDKNFQLVKETFDESEDKNLMTDESRGRLRRKVDDLNSRWEEMWRGHDVNKTEVVQCSLLQYTVIHIRVRLVQAILIMGGQWMGRVNNNLDELEEDINSIEFQEDDMKALREEEQKHKEIMNRISSYEVSVSGAVDVAREVQRRDLVTDETGETITNETEELEERLERLKAEAEDKKKSISASLLKSRKPQPLMRRKFTYESLITQKMKELKKESKSMNDWMDITERLVKSLSVDMDSKQATRVSR